MLRAYKYRLLPTKAQAELINKHFGSCRFIYNLAMETKQMAYLGAKKSLSAFDLMKQMTDLKKEKEYEWLNEINAQSLQNSIVNLDKAYTAFFKHGAKYPNFKNRHSKQSFSCPQSVECDFEKGKLYLPKFRGGIKSIFTREFKGTIKTVTISRTTTGKYFASVLVDTGKALPKPKNVKEATAIGIDLGLKSFIATSGGLSVGHPKFLKSSMPRLKVLQRRASKKVKGSTNRKKANRKVALLHERLSNQRTDFLHKLSSSLIGENQTVCVEDLNVSGMIKNHNLAQAISDSGWTIFVQMLEYKAAWYGKNFIRIGRFEPSSKICSACGATNHTLTLADREWLCANCGTMHDRDINAAKNIKAFGLKQYCNHSGGVSPDGPVELPTMVGAVKQEVALETEG